MAIGRDFVDFLGDGMNAIRVKNGSIADGRKITVNNEISSLKI